MTPIKLKALRQLLFFSVDEAAALVAATADRPAGVSSRAWRHWEDGRRPVPADVATMLQQLADYRLQVIHKMECMVMDAVRLKGSGEIAARVEFAWYDTPEEWATHSLVAPAWRPTQSAQAHVAATMPEVVLVPYRQAVTQTLS